MANTKVEGEIVRVAHAGDAAGAGSNWLEIVAAWAVVGLPLAWGVFTTLKKAAQLFQ
jgi:hypothetical protein